MWECVYVHTPKGTCPHFSCEANSKMRGWLRVLGVVLVGAAGCSWVDCASRSEQKEEEAVNSEETKEFQGLPLVNGMMQNRLRQYRAGKYSWKDAEREIPLGLVMMICGFGGMAFSGLVACYQTEPFYIVMLLVLVIAFFMFLLVGLALMIVGTRLISRLLKGEVQS